MQGQRVPWAVAVAVLLSVGLGRVMANELIWGTLCTSSGPSVMDWMVQDWIDDYFEDGSKGDGSVGSNILMVGTSCYFGDFKDNFNSGTGDAEGGGAFDTVSFTNTSWMSANEAGKTAIYGGFDDDAAKALKPGNSAGEVLLAGWAGKDDSETPDAQGPDNPVGGTTSTHVLVWAGQPNGEDRSQINNIQNNFNGNPNTTVTVLAGNGTAAQGGPNVDGAATLDNLKSTLQTIGAQMDDGADEQFVFYVTDHGDIEKIDTNANNSGHVMQPVVVDPNPPPIPIPMPTPVLEDMLNDPLNEPTLWLFSPVQVWDNPPLNPTEPIQTELIQLQLNGNPVGLLSEATLLSDTLTPPELILPLPGDQNPDWPVPLPLGGGPHYWWEFEGIPESFFDVSHGLPESLQLVEILNGNPSNPIFFSAVGLGSGEIAKLLGAVIPEPASLGILTLGLAGLLLRRRTVLS